MRAAAVGDHRDPGHAWQERVSRPANVVFVGVGMILVQLAYRAWAVQGGWFLIDDYGFLANGVGRDLSWHYLFTPYGDHLQPLGFLIVWAVSQSTPYDWFLASTITMAFQALASAACLVFLLRLCGRRWSVLVPLAFYLFSVVTLPGFMWWAAAIVQVPLQLFAFLAMTAHLEYVRTRRLRYAALAAVALSLGMLCDVKILFAGLCFVFLSLYLSDGHGPRGRLRDGLLGQWRAWLLYAVMLAGYLMGYLRLNPVADRGVEAPGAIFETMLRYAMGPVLLGGPWKWGPSGDAPLPPPGPPEWAVTITWVVIVLLVIQAVRRQRATAWAVVLFVVAVGCNVMMVSAARGAVFGGVAGLEIRYLGDLAPTLVLVVAVLATSLDARRSTPPAYGGRTRPAVAPETRRRVWYALGGLAALGGAMVSSTLYVQRWHDDYPARVYVQNVLTASSARPLVVVDQQVPQNVIPREGPTSFEVPSQVFKPLGDRLVASLRVNDPDALDASGVPYRATITAQRESDEGPVTGCGYPIGVSPTTIPLDPVPGRDPLSEFWWGSIGYLAGDNGSATFTIDGVSTDMEVQRGLHDFVFLGRGPVDEVVMESRSDMAMCVDNVKAGTIAPRQPEEADR